MFGRKKGKYEGMDTDKDNLDDQYEVDINRHSKDNKPYHPIKSFNIGKHTYSKDGVIGIHHDHLRNITKPFGTNGVTVKGGKSVKLTVDMKQPKFDGTTMKTIKVPKAEMKEPKRFSSTFSEDYINERIKRILGKKKK
jgi:hypothetical protein